jgi:radical SAM protein with 4Fe4S-binding SPASM domain
MRESIKQNIERKIPKINDVKIYNGFPLFSFVELNVNELCNRTCVFCPRVDPKTYPNQNLHMDIELASEISKQLLEVGFGGIVNISGTGEATLTKHLPLIVKKFGDKKIHIEIVTNGDFLKPKLISDLYSSGLKQLVVSMYDGPEQIEYFNNLFDECDIDKDLYTLRDRWYDEDEDYGLIYTNRAGSMGEKLLFPHERPCYYPHYAAYIDWNGDVLLCCQDMYNRTVIFGNILEKKLVDIWVDKKLNDFRKKLVKGERTISPCNNCTANGMVFGENHSKLWSKL